VLIYENTVSCSGTLCSTRWNNSISERIEGMSYRKRERERERERGGGWGGERSPNCSTWSRRSASKVPSKLSILLAPPPLSLSLSLSLCGADEPFLVLAEARKNRRRVGTRLDYRGISIASFRCRHADLPAILFDRRTIPAGTGRGWFTRSGKLPRARARTHVSSKTDRPGVMSIDQMKFVS
jgi:hypothetical protein